MNAQQEAVTSNVISLFSYRATPPGMPPGSRMLPQEEIESAFGYEIWICSVCDLRYAHYDGRSVQHVCWLECGHRGCDNPAAVISHSHHWCDACRCTQIKPNGERCTQAQYMDGVCGIHLHRNGKPARATATIPKGWKDATYTRLPLPACYVIFVDGKLYYIGSAVNLSSRLGSHEKLSGIRKSRIKIKARYFHRNTGLWLACEVRMIGRLDPPGNTMFRVRA